VFLDPPLKSGARNAHQPANTNHRYLPRHYQLVHLGAAETEDVGDLLRTKQQSFCHMITSFCLGPGATRRLLGVLVVQWPSSKCVHLRIEFLADRLTWPLEMPFRPRASASTSTERVLTP